MTINATPIRVGIKTNAFDRNTMLDVSMTDNGRQISDDCISLAILVSLSKTVDLNELGLARDR